MNSRNYQLTKNIRNLISLELNPGSFNQKEEFTQNQNTKEDVNNERNNFRTIIIQKLDRVNKNVLNEYKNSRQFNKQGVLFHSFDVLQRGDTYLNQMISNHSDLNKKVNYSNNFFVKGQRICISRNKGKINTQKSMTYIPSWRKKYPSILKNFYSVNSKNRLNLRKKLNSSFRLKKVNSSVQVSDNNFKNYYGNQVNKINLVLRPVSKIYENIIMKLNSKGKIEYIENNNGFKHIKSIRSFDTKCFNRNPKTQRQIIIDLRKK